MKQSLFLLLATSFLVSACTTSSPKEILRQKMAARISRVMVFPNECIFTQLAEDTVELESSKSLKIVRYIDSSGCIGCRMNLGGWKTFGNFIDSISDKKVQQLIVIQTRKAKDAEAPILSAKYDKPVCIDIVDNFGNANKRILETGFNVFLLDGNNKIILVGDPMANTAIRELYINTSSKCFNPCLGLAQSLLRRTVISC